MSTFTFLLSIVARVILLKRKPDHIPPPMASHLIQRRNQSHHNTRLYMNGTPSSYLSVCIPTLSFASSASATLTSLLFLSQAKHFPAWGRMCSLFLLSRKVFSRYTCILTISFMSLTTCHVFREIFSVIVYKISTLTPPTQSSAHLLYILYLLSSLNVV